MKYSYNTTALYACPPDGDSLTNLKSLKNVTVYKKKRKNYVNNNIFPIIPGPNTTFGPSAPGQVRRSGSVQIWVELQSKWSKVSQFIVFKTTIPFLTDEITYILHVKCTKILMYMRMPLPVM